MPGNPEFFNSGAAVIQATVRSSPGALIEAWGTNNSGGALFLQIHNANGALGGGETPLVSFRVGDGAFFNLDERHIPLEAFTTGIVIGWSSTEDTFTAAAGNVGWIHARHRA